MEFLIPLLIIFNILLGTALFVVKMAQMDQRHAQRVRESEEYKSHFRDDRWQ